LFRYPGDDRPVPDLQYLFPAGTSAKDGVAGVGKGRSGITLNCCGLRPKARGTVGSPLLILPGCH
jgi:hypothetical protein